jgi:phosphoenolpyruvate-protein kinase (PTS system EI component)
VQYGAESIGLVRSEFLQPGDGRRPDARFYETALRRICEAAAPLEVTIRLLDVAPDKFPAWLPPATSCGGVLGMQGSRLFGHELVRSVLRAQLEAIDALSVEFGLRVLIPYLVRYEELAYRADEVRRHLSQQLPLGAMVETPASALDLARLFDYADFVALGCNDLMQCLFAADRDCAELRDYLDPYAPVLFRFLRQLAQTAGNRIEDIQLCGVLAQLQGILPVLLGLGYRAFSVEPSLLSSLRSTLKATRLADAVALADNVCEAARSEQVLEILRIPRSGYRPFLP